MAVVEKSAAGRPQMSAQTGPTYKLAEFLNNVWDSRVGYTNFELAQEWGYRSPGIISMWRTGRSRVPIERLPDLARLLNTDLAQLLPLWLEQYVGQYSTAYKAIEAVFKRLATTNEFAVLRAMRAAAKTRGQKDPVYTARQVQAFEQVAANDKFADFVLEEAKKQGMIAEIEEPDDD